ncbi:MAG TPA: type II toxin-antitoxin system HicB family antitoxin [Stellaceae bacterium]|nr:type II toxin-antitoxin system HicB family antitoxin [Stellaceae bacterium]
MRAFDFRYPARLRRDGAGRILVKFRDLPEALTDGADADEALREAADCLDEAIAGRILRGEPIPKPSAPRHDERVVPVPAHTAAQAALHLVVRDLGIGKSELARRLGYASEKDARRLLDPRHPSKIERIEAALAVLGSTLEVRLRKIA